MAMPGRSRRIRPFQPLSPERTFALFVGLLVATFLMGGGSRPDIESLVVLRPLALLAAAAGVVGLDRATLQAYRVPFLFLAALAVLMAAQLVPLPPALWTQLPSREIVARLDEAVGLAGIWRPLTLSPMRTANSLASLAVPFAVLVLYCQLSERRRRHVLVALVAIAVTGAVLGFFQLLAGGDSGLYFYAVTHRGDAVGFFANRNHHAAFMAAAMLVAIHLAMERGGAPRDMFSIFALAGAVVLFAGVLTNVSRGGLLSGAVALVLAPLVVPSQNAGRAGRRWIAGAMLAAPALGIFALFTLSQHSPALSRLLADSTADDMRLQILPVLIEMARAYQPWGAGFGAFEQAYRMAEPAALLVPNYFNNAHNDWLQFAIEGGTPAVLIAAAMAAALAIRLAGLVRARDGRGDPRSARAWLGFAVLAVLGFASLFDYPLRVPSLMGVAFVALTELFSPVLAQNRQKGCGGARSL
jgi:O-antigen ligase